MSNTICGADCSICGFQDTCGGCVETNGRPFGKECIVAKCCLSKGHKNCTPCDNLPCTLKEQAIAEFNALGIPDMPEVTSLNQLIGSFINLTYTLPNGQAIKMLEDEKIYLANQLPKRGSDRCYGIMADESYLMVCEYGECGSDPEIIVYKKRGR